MRILYGIYTAKDKAGLITDDWFAVAVNGRRGEELYSDNFELSCELETLLDLPCVDIQHVTYKVVDDFIEAVTLCIYKDENGWNMTCEDGLIDHFEMKKVLSERLRKDDSRTIVMIRQYIIPEILL